MWQAVIYFGSLNSPPAGTMRRKFSEPPPPQTFAALLALAILVLGAACRSDDSSAQIQTPSPSPHIAETKVHQPADLVDAALALVGFLQGSVGYDQIALADQVALHLAEENLNPGGQNPRILSADALRDPRNWQIFSPITEITYEFAPPANLEVVHAVVGRHFECLETTLAEHNLDALGSLPHVGTMLYPENGNTCLQSWNLTFVFDPVLQPPTLVAVVYAQWEW